MESVILEINERLKNLSEETLVEINHYVSYMTEKERKHTSFVEETLRIEANPDFIICNSVEEVMTAIYNADED